MRTVTGWVRSFRPFRSATRAQCAFIEVIRVARAASALQPSSRPAVWPMSAATCWPHFSIATVGTAAVSMRSRLLAGTLSMLPL